MKFSGLLAAAIILLILAGVLFWSNHRKPAETTTAANATPAILKIDTTAVTSLTVKQKDASPVTVVRKSPGVWQITSPMMAAANSDAVSGVLSTVNSLNSQRVVQDKATDLSQYGLSNPSVELDVTGRNNKTEKLLIGDDTPTGDAVYAAVAGDPRVFTAATYVKTSLNKSLNDLREKRLVPVESGSISSIDLTRKDENIEFGRVQDGWQIEKPATYRTDTYQVDDLLQQVIGAKWDPATSSDQAASAFAKADPLATVKLTGGSGSNTLEVRKDHEDYYAKSSAVTGIYKVDPTLATSLGQALTRSLDDYRNKQVFSFGYTDPNKIEYHSGATNLILTRSGTDWTSDGRKMDAQSVEALMTALRDLATAKFADSGFHSPDTEITVTSGGGKKVEKVGLQKTADGALAKREDGTELYSLDANAIREIQSAVSGIKPAVAAKK